MLIAKASDLKKYKKRIRSFQILSYSLLVIVAIGHASII